MVTYDFLICYKNYILFSVLQLILFSSIDDPYYNVFAVSFMSCHAEIPCKKVDKNIKFCNNTLSVLFVLLEVHFLATCKVK